MPSAPIRLRQGFPRWYDGWSRYLALFAAIITLVSTTIAFLTTGKDLGGEGELITACIGLLGLVVSLQLETLFRVAERTRTREQYGTLLEMVEDHPELLPLMSGALSASVATLKRTSIAQFKDEVLNILINADVRLQELSQGRLRATAGDSTLTLDRFADTKMLLQATTDDRDTSWWLQDSGTKFLELNATLVEERGVRIERLWILSKPPDVDTREIIKKHHEVGVTVFVLRADNKDLDRRLLVNMTMMDGAFLHEDLPNKQGQAVEYLFSENSADIKRAMSRFAQLKTLACEYKDEQTLDVLFKSSTRPRQKAKPLPRQLT